jgi:gluconate 2-dehydrogenase gamma chain
MNLNGRPAHLDRTHHQPAREEEAAVGSTPTSDEDGTEGRSRRVDRRTFVKRAAVTAGGVALLGSLRLGAGEATAGAAESAAGPLDGSEMSTLEAVLQQVIPKDELGPGAVEIGVSEYIQGSLEGSYKPLLGTYKTFLSTLDTAAGGSFASLSSADQTKLLERVEAGQAPRVPAASKAAAAEIFQLVLEHTREGMFGDPMYGGNKNLAGWELIGYPGIQLVVSERLQEIDTEVPSTGMTAASYGAKPYNGVPL